MADVDLTKDNVDNDDTNVDDNKSDDGMTDGVPTDVSNAIDKVLEDHKNDHSNADDFVDDDTDDKSTDDSTDVDDDSADDNSADGGDDDTDKVEGIEVLGYDAETVQKLNDIDPDIVKDIKALLQRGSVDNSSEDDDSIPVKKIDKVEIEGTVTEEQIAELEKENPAMAAIVKGLNSSVEKLSTALATVTEDEADRTEETEKKEHYRNFCSLNKRLDELTEDFPLLGTYDKLPMNSDGVPDDRNRSVIARAEIWGKANALFSTGMFGSFEESMEGAVTLYQGKHGENLAMRKVSKELRERSKHMTSRPSRTKTKQKQPKPGSNAHMEQIVGDALKKSGATA